jgi:hypothetical protein
MGTTARADWPPAVRNVSESGDAVAPTSSLSAAVARASMSTSVGARGTELCQPPAALPATTSLDAEAQQSGLPAMVARLETGALAGEMRTPPRASPPPAALAAPPAIAVHDDLGIETAGEDVKGVAQRAPTSLPLRTVDETTQTATAAPATRGGAVVCRDGCAGGSCGETHAWTVVPAAIKYQKNCYKCTSSHHSCVFESPTHHQCSRCVKNNLLCFFKNSGESHCFQFQFYSTQLNHFCFPFFLSRTRSS